MEENRDIDSLFKSSLEKFDMVPSVDLWSSLDIELTRKLEARLKKRNRRLLLLCFLLVLIPGTAYYLIHNLNKQNKQNLVEYKIEAAKAEKIEKAPLVKKYENANAIWDNKALNSNKSSSVSNSSFNGQQANSKATQHSSNRTNQRFEHARHSIKLQTVSKNNLDSKRKLIKENKGKINTPITFNQLESETTSLLESDLIKQMIVTEQLNSSTINKSPINKNFDRVTDINISNSGLISDSIANRKDIIQENPKRLEPISLSTNKEMDKDSIIPSSTKLNKNDNVKALAATLVSSENKDFKNGLYIDFLLSPIYTINYLQNNSAYKSNDDAIDYRSREKSKFSFSTGIALRYDLNRRWGISLGAYYSTIAYSMALSTVYANKNLNDEVHFQYPTSWGTIEIPNAPNSALNVGDSLTINSTCNQLLKLVNIPLIFRYTITRSKFSFYANIGASANFTIRDQAIIKTGTFEFSYTNSLIGKREFNCSILLGFGLNYKITNRLSIFMEPNYRASITTVTEDIPVNCYPQSIGISTGLNFRLN